MLRFLTAGESHGQALVVVMEGLPAGLPITVEQIQEEMGRRRLGYGRGPRQRFEQDSLLERLEADNPVNRRALSVTRLVAGTDAGITFEPGNPDDLADAIEQVLTNNELATLLVANARDLVERKYAWSAIARTTSELYSDVWIPESLACSSSSECCRKILPLHRPQSRQQAAVCPPRVQLR